jgi:hypothetical protein
MTAATLIAWLLFAFLLGYLAHVLIQALDPRDPWNCGYDEGWREGRRFRWARVGVVEGKPERK